jgi:transglutaminase-like putative cysteine protease
MRFNVSSQVRYTVNGPSTLILSVHYSSGSTNWLASTNYTLTERAGLCRDFARLGIALCRALSIPARYFADDERQLYSPDFHACFEAHIGGSRSIFDPTSLMPLSGLVRNANERDAVDAAGANIFCQACSKVSEVSCGPAEAGFKPLTIAQLSKKGICLDAP